MKRDDELEPELKALLGSRRVVRRAPPEVRARALIGARRILDGQGMLPPAPRAVPSRALAPVRARRVVRVAVAACIAIGAGTVGAVMFVPGRPLPAPAPVSLGASRPVPPRNGPAAVTAPATPQPVVVEPSVSARRRRAGGELDSLAVQLEMLQRAQAAYTRQDFTSALALLAEHARRFPRGHLAEEREALRVRSLLAAGRGQEARHAAAQFARRFPRSVLLPSLQDEERALE